MNPIREYLMIGKLVALLVAIALICWQSSQIHRWHHQFDSERIARIADRTAYQQAQSDAALQNHADVQRIATQQQKVTTDVETDYRSKLDALRHELRAQPPAAQGSAGKPGVSQVPNAAGGPGGQAVPLPSGELLRAAETELQLNALIDWVEQQSSVQH